MWKQIFRKSNIRELKSITCRGYLTEAYKLNSEWDQRLKTTTLEKINAETLFVDLTLKFQQKKQINAVDVDIYANKVDVKNVDDAVDLAQKLRSTAQAWRMFESTQHAIIRLLSSHPEHLITVLNHRIEYGIFPDNYSINLLLDQFIKEKNYMIAARLATFQMLQEDFEHPITRYMSLLACYKFLDNLETFVDLIPPPPPEVEKQPTGKSKKKPEEKKVRVKYLRNSFFDEHFDIKDTNHLLGKTFLYLAEEVRSADEVLANSIELLGYALFQKYENGCKFLTQMKSTFYQEAVDKVKALAEKAENLDDEGKKFFDLLNSISSQKDGKIEGIIEGFLKQAIQEHESKDIEEQKKTFTLWNNQREEKLKEEIERITRIKRLEDVEKLQFEMNLEEKKLWFFDNLDQIKLDIQKVRQKSYPKRFFGKKKPPRKADVNYVPPDIDNITRGRRAR